MGDCIYCGHAATSVDHVPPKGLIRPSRRVDLWTVDSCDQCNGGSSGDEEYFRLMVVGALCHTPEADELFDGSISRSMDKRPSKESWLFDSLGVVDGQPCIEWDLITLHRVALKIARGLAHRMGLEQPALNSLSSLEELEGRGDYAQWAPDFSFSQYGGRWELWFFDSVRIVVRPA
jgi:hypothetical protein